MRLTRWIFIFGYLWSGLLWAQDSQPASEPVSEADSQPASQPSFEATSQPVLEPASQPASEPTSEPDLAPAPEPLSEGEPEEPAPASAQVEEHENVDILPLPPPPGPAAAIGNEIFAAFGLGLVGGAAGALGGVFLAAQDNNLTAAVEETALGWAVGASLGAGLGAGLSGRSHGRGGSRLGAFVGSLVLGGAASFLGHQVSEIRQSGFSEARAPEVFLFVIPFVASVTGSVLGYELFPRKKVVIGEKPAQPEKDPPSALASFPAPVALPLKSANK